MGQGLKYIKPYMSFTLWEEHGLSMMWLDNIWHKETASDRTMDKAA